MAFDVLEVCDSEYNMGCQDMIPSSTINVDPNKVPYRTLYTGAKIPAVGLGTFGSDRYSADDIAKAVKGAINIGYRHIDCAAVYGNESQIGRVLKEILDVNRVQREELWITSKLWNNKHGEADVIPACQQTLKDLQLNYLDLYLVHWPFPNYHPPGCDIDSRSADAQPYIHGNFMTTWRQMETLVDMGLVRHIGTSNMTTPKLKLLLQDARIQPACNEMELHPHFQQPELFQFVCDNNIVPIGFCPIGSPKRPDRDKTAHDTLPTEDPVIANIAQRLQLHPAVVCIKWAVHRGQVPIPFSIHENKYRANLKCVTETPLTEQDMKDISSIDKNCRLVKGQVFLWKENQSWEALWDLEGEITPP